MKCPFCSSVQDRVIDSRATQDEVNIRRRRECLKCGRRFTTYESIEELPLMVIKKDNRREPFSRAKILNGLVRACEKRPVSIEKIEEIVVSIEQQILKKYEREVNSRQIGELVMERLAKLDDVAYVRFASVYRQFKDINQFMRELSSILSKEKKKSKK
ncbi:MAG: transcriptional regulator NrdR [Candidatus Omnitrophota bacterium]